jgi:DNA-binding response OmpR family regulator
MLVEDDDAVARTMVDALDSGAYRVWLAGTGAEAKTLLENASPDAIILDLMLPDVDGLVLCSSLRAATDAPILICSAILDRRERVLGLKLGADDFIAKPFDIFELEARLEAVIRRAARPSSRAPRVAPANKTRVGILVIDRIRRRVTLGGKSLQLTPTEYKVLSVLAGRPGNTLSRRDLAIAVWGYEDPSAGRAIDVHIRRLRVKMAAAHAQPPAIVAARAVGYRMDDAAV